MDIPWDDVRLFLAVAESGSLSAAARRLRIAQPTASRRLAELEATLGETLFLRGVGGTALTSYGERLVEPARRMAEWAGDIERAADRRDTRPRGVVRLTAPPGIAAEFVAPFAAFAKERLPDVRLEVIATVHYLDLSRREADLALRMERPRQRDLVTLFSLEHEVAAYAAPKYIAGLRRRYGLADVDWIAWAPPLEQLSPNRELCTLIAGFSPVFASDNFLVQLRAAEAGVGAIFLPRVRHRFSRDAILEELDVDIGRVSTALHLVCARSALDIPRVRAVAELIRSELEHTKTRFAARRPKARHSARPS
jgi:DNA-binding transcriptional LysR family regulator